MTRLFINLIQPRTGRMLRSSERLVASADGSHCFTFRPDWNGTAPLPFRAAAATVTLLGADRPLRVLILGFGLGAMGSMMRKHQPMCQVTGVEPDRRLYRNALDALTEGIELHRTDAVRFLERTDRQFDLVLDDCYEMRTLSDSGGSEPYRPPALEVLPALAKSRMVPGGLYVRNLLDQEDLTLMDQQLHILNSFASAAERRFKSWDNVLTVASDAELDSSRIAHLGRRDSKPSKPSTVV